MARTPAIFRTADVARAVAGVVKAGCEIARVEIDRAGKIVIIVGKPADQAAPDDDANEWDSVA